MDNITITIADPGLDWLALYICLGIAGLALAVAIFLPKIVRLSTPDWDSDDTESLWLLSCVAIIISVVVGVGCVVTAYGDEVEEFKVEALEGVGLSNISFDGHDT